MAFPIVAIVGVFTMIVLVVAIPVVASHRYKRRVTKLNAAVKQQMIERGYSVEEILAVIKEDARDLTTSRNTGKTTPSKLPSQTPV